MVCNKTYTCINRYNIKKLTLLIVLLESAFVLRFILESSMTSSIRTNLARTAHVIRNKLSRCPSEKMEAIQNTSLPVRLHDNVSMKDSIFVTCFRINTTASGLYRLLNEHNFGQVTCNTTEKRFLDRRENPFHTALASYPGSGNTWVRHLLEELTGIHTGSLYMDQGLKTVFYAERYTEGVIAIKTHETVDRLKKLKFDRVILLVRDPFDALLSSYNLGLTMSHTGIPSRTDFHNGSFHTHVTTDLVKWAEFYMDWSQKFEGQMFVLFYDNLKTDLLNTLTKMAAFLETNVTLRELWCINKRKDGLFRRGERPNWMDRPNVIDEELDKNITSVKKLVYNELRMGNNTT